MGDGTTVRSDMITSQFDSLNFETDLVDKVLTREIKNAGKWNMPYSPSRPTSWARFSQHTSSLQEQCH